MDWAGMKGTGLHALHVPQAKSGAVPRRTTWQDAPALLLQVGAYTWAPRSCVLVTLQGIMCAVAVKIVPLFAHHWVWPHFVSFMKV